MEIERFQTTSAVHSAFFHTAEVVEEPLESPIGEINLVRGLELLAKNRLQRGAVVDIVAMLVFQVAKLLDELFFKFAFGGSHGVPAMSCRACEVCPKVGGNF